jgi:hypothetical protein
MSPYANLQTVVPAWMGFFFTKRAAVRNIVAGRLQNNIARGKGKKAQDRAAMLRPLPILSEEDVDAMAEQDSEGRIFNRQFPINPHD